MYWASGPSLGLLAILGYVLFVLGAALLWRQRSFLNLWAQDEFGSFRRDVARCAASAGGSGLREETRFKLLPRCFLPSLEPARRVRINRAAVLVVAGPILFLLDFLL